MKFHLLAVQCRSGTLRSMSPGQEWIIDASECLVTRIDNVDSMRQLCDRIIQDLGLHVVGRPQWHQFPDPGGVKAMYLLSESHLTCHTYPEYRLATLNLY